MTTDVVVPTKQLTEDELRGLAQRAWQFAQPEHAAELESIADLIRETPTARTWADVETVLGPDRAQARAVELRTAIFGQYGLTP
jgi:hypothetical protein